jgi:hypothetical protein
MTPKEKALELIKEYDFVYIPYYSSKFEVKQAVIILCDNFIEWFSQYTGMNDQIYFDADKNYWEEVKLEIEKL